MGGKFSWKKVTEQQARDLSKQLFNAAQVPTSVRQQYWAEFARLKAGLKI